MDSGRAGKGIGGKIIGQANHQMIIFDEDRHKYTLGGRRLPSVTEIVRYITKQDLSDIPWNILREKAQFGINVHLACELYSTTGIHRDDLSLQEQSCLDEWVRLSKGLKTVDTELVVHFEDKYAGTLDNVSHDGEGLVLIDYKTTYKLDKEYVTWQANYYRMAYGDVYKMQVAWLPKGRRGQLITLDKIDDDILKERLKEFYEQA